MFSGFQSTWQSQFPSSTQGWSSLSQDHLQDPTWQRSLDTPQPVFGQTSLLGGSFPWGQTNQTLGGTNDLPPESGVLAPLKRKWVDESGGDRPTKKPRLGDHDGLAWEPQTQRDQEPPEKPSRSPTLPGHIFGSQGLRGDEPRSFSDFKGFGLGSSPGVGGFGSPGTTGHSAFGSFGFPPPNKVHGDQDFGSSLFNTRREPTKEWKRETPSWSIDHLTSREPSVDHTGEYTGMDLEINTLISMLEGLKLESLEVSPVEFEPSEELSEFLGELPPGHHDIQLGQRPRLSVEQTIAAILEHHGGMLQGRQLHLPQLDPTWLSAATTGDALAEAVQGRMGPVDVTLEVDPQGDASLFAQVNPRAKVAKITHKKGLSRARLESGWIMGNESEYQDKVGIRDEAGEVIDGASPFESMRHVMEVYRAQQLDSVRKKKKLSLGDTIKDKQGNIVIGNIQVSGARREQSGFGETKVFQRPVHSGDWLAIYSSGEGAKGVTGDKLKLPRGYATQDDVEHFSVQKYDGTPNKPTQNKHNTFKRFLGGKSAKVVGVNPRWEEQKNNARSLSVESKSKMTTKLSTKQPVKKRPSKAPIDMYPDRKVKYDASSDAHSEAALWQTFQANDQEIAAWIDNLPIDQIWHLVVNIESEREMCGGCSAKSNTMLAQLDTFAPKVHQALTDKNIKFKPETSVDAFLKFEAGGPCALNDHSSPHTHGFGKAIENKDTRKFLGLEKPGFDETFEEDPLSWRSTTRMSRPPTVESVKLSDSTLDPNVTPLDPKKKAVLFGSHQANVKDGKLDGDWSAL